MPTLCKLSLDELTITIELDAAFWLDLAGTKRNVVVLLLDSMTVWPISSLDSLEDAKLEAENVLVTALSSDFLRFDSGVRSAELLQLARRFSRELRKCCWILLLVPVLVNVNMGV